MNKAKRSNICEKDIQLVNCKDFLSNFTDEIENVKLNEENEKKKGKKSRQPVNETINPIHSGPMLESAPVWNFPEEEDELQQQHQSGQFFAANEFDYPPEANSDDQYDDVKPPYQIKPNDDSIQDAKKIKELEKEKEDLQQRLSDAKNALSEYTSKLDNQV